MRPRSEDPTEPSPPPGETREAIALRTDIMFEFVASLLHPDAPSTAGFAQWELDRYVDLSVDTIDPRLRAVPHYKRRLRSAVATSLSYASDLIQNIPGPLEVCRRAFTTDPQVRAFFVSVDHMQEVFGDSQEVRTFFEHPLNAGQQACYAFMVMNRRDSHTLGVELEGDCLRREVAQTRVSFTNHRVVKPTGSEAAVRHQLCERALRNLIGEALGYIASRQNHRYALAARRTELRTKRKRREVRFHALQGLHADCEQDAECHALDLELAEVQRALDASAARLTTLDDTLEQLCVVLHHPSEHCRLERRSVRVDNLGVQVDEQSSRSGHDVSYADIHVGPVERAGVIVRYPRAELPAAHGHLCLEANWLGSSRSFAAVR
jgi:hypothetical protein